MQKGDNEVYSAKIKKNNHTIHLSGANELLRNRYNATGF